MFKFAIMKLLKLEKQILAKLKKTILLKLQKKN